MNDPYMTAVALVLKACKDLRSEASNHTIGGGRDRLLSGAFIPDECWREFDERMDDLEQLEELEKKGDQIDNAEYVMEDR